MRLVTKFSETGVAQFIAVCRRSKMVATSTRRPRRGLRLCRRWALQWREDDQLLGQCLRATKCDKLSAGGLAEKLTLVGEPSACWVEYRTKSTERKVQKAVRCTAYGKGFSFFLQIHITGGRHGYRLILVSDPRIAGFSRH